MSKKYFTILVLYRNGELSASLHAGKTQERARMNAKKLALVYLQNEAEYLGVVLDGNIVLGYNALREALRESEDGMMDIFSVYPIEEET